MAKNPSPPPRSGSGGGLSLYAKLLDPSSSSSATITAAPVLYKVETAEDDASKKQQASLAASLRFQPTKRPQQQNAAAVAAKAKAKALASKFAPPVETVEQPKPEKTTIADWAATGSDDDWNIPEKRQRGGRKKRKKGNDTAQQLIQNWDDIYDPSRPNSYEEYKQSEEKIAEVREWKDLLYRHRMKRREATRSESETSERPMSRRFAPPMSFAPPSNLNDEPTPPPPPPPAAEVPDDTTGDDAYARRMRLSQAPPPPPPGVPPPSHTITRAPIRYSLPEASSDLPANETELATALASSPQSSDLPKSSRPGQANFAERYLAAQGWKAGTGLGARGTGIINPLYAKADKRKKKSDAEGGAFVTPATTGKILGGSKSKEAREEEEAGPGAMSEVVRLEHMLDGMDLDEEMQRGEGGILQEIGEECGEKYGSVERVYIHRGVSAVVFVMFVSQLSALRAVNALEGRVFNGNVIAARFWPKEDFERAVYE